MLKPGELASMVELVSKGPGVAIEIDVDGFEGLELQRDPSGARHIASALWGGSFGTVGSLVPSGYEAYARVAYPLYSPETTFPTPDGTLFDILASHTNTPDEAWFCLWEGYGGLDAIPADVQLLDVPPSRPMRTYLLFRGALSAWAAMAPFPSCHVPDLAWPQDRTWFLGTDTDIDWGFVGGPEACVRELERHSKLEVVRVTLADPLAPPNGQP